MAAPAEQHFRAFDLTGKFPHTIPNVFSISSHILRAGEWPQTRSLHPITTTLNEQLVIEAIRTDRSLTGQCEQCGTLNSSPSSCCESHCYPAFVAEHFSHSLVELRGPGRHGYGAFVAQGRKIRKGQYLGEYIGELRPLGKVNKDLAVGVQSLYRFDFDVHGGPVIADSEKRGNWTRFVNSSCGGNVKVWATFVGKRHMFLFQALRDIKEGEELTFFYGSSYFEAANMLCGCSARKGMHKAKAL